MRALKVIGVGVLVVAGLAVIGAASGTDKQNNTDNNSSEKATTTQQTVEQNKKLNEPARDGRFEFTVKAVECGKTTVGANQYANRQAQGQFCLLTVNVKNIGDNAQALFSANQKILNSNNQQFVADDLATTYHNPDGQTLFSNINPGNSVEGVIVFDIPKDQTPAVAELHDSAFSGGVKVDLK